MRDVLVGLNVRRIATVSNNCLDDDTILLYGEFAKKNVYKYIYMYKYTIGELVGEWDTKIARVRITHVPVKLYNNTLVMHVWYNRLSNGSNQTDME